MEGELAGRCTVFFFFFFKEVKATPFFRGIVFTPTGRVVFPVFPPYRVTDGTWALGSLFEEDYGSNTFDVCGVIVFLDSDCSSAALSSSRCDPFSLKKC